MSFSLACFALLVAASVPVTAATLFPEISIQNDLDMPTGEGVENREETRGSGVDSNGFRYENLDVSWSASNLIDPWGPTGSSARTESQGVFSSGQRQRIVLDENVFRFEQSYQFAVDYERELSMSQMGRQFLILFGDVTTSLFFQRVVEFSLSEPIHLQLSLSGGTSMHDFRDLLSSVMIFDNPMTEAYFATQRSTFSSDTGTTIFQTEHTGTEARYQLIGRGDSRGIELDFLFEPLDAARPAELQLRWFIEDDSSVELGPYSRTGSYHDVVAISGSVDESLVIRPIPEPLVLTMSGLGLLVVVLRRRA